MENTPTGGLAPVNSSVTTGGGRQTYGRPPRSRAAVAVLRPPKLRSINFPRRFNGGAIRFGVDLDVPFERSGLQSPGYVTKVSIDGMDHDYVTAKCHLLISPDCNLPEVFRDADTAVPWSNVLEVRCFQTETTACPICLFPPVAPRMGPCGHIYCYPCVWYFIKYENDLLSRQCAVCNTYLRINELKRVRLCPTKIPLSDNIVEFSLMKRYRSLAFPIKFDSDSSEKPSSLLTAGLASNFLSRVAVASRQDLVKLIREDIVAMDTYLADCRSNALSDCMIPAAETILRVLESELAAADVPACKVAKSMRSVELNDSELERPYLYYKAVNGQDIYLHSVNWRCLQLEYDTDNLPRLISGRVIEVESCILTEDLRRRYRYLGHLPLGRTFYLVEIDMEPPLISYETVSKMSEALTYRQLRREQRDHIDQMLTQAKEEAENRIQSLPIGSHLVGHMALENDVPTDEDFVPLSVATGTVEGPTSSSAAPRPTRSFASVSKSGACEVVDNHRVANFPKQTLEKLAHQRHSLSGWFDVSSVGGIGPLGSRAHQQSPPEAWPSLAAANVSQNIITTTPGDPTTPMPNATRKNKRHRNANKNAPPLEELAKNLSLVRNSPSL